MANNINGTQLLNRVDEEALKEKIGISSRIHRNGILVQIAQLKSEQKGKRDKREVENKLNVERNLVELERERVAVNKQERDLKQLEEEAREIERMEIQEEKRKMKNQL